MLAIVASVPRMFLSSLPSTATQQQAVCKRSKAFCLVLAGYYPVSKSGEVGFQGVCGPGGTDALV